MIPAGIYARVSKDDATQTTANQLPSLQRMAAARGLEVVEVYEDEMSGVKGKMERPGLARLFADAARGRIRAVLVWALDRISRDDTFAGGLLLIGELDHYRCALLSHEETWLDTAGPFREPLVALSLKMAASERSRLIARTKEGLARARREGTKSGRPIGVPPANVSPAAVARALALRAEPLNGPGYQVSRRSWREVRERLIAERLLLPYPEGKRQGQYPDHTSVYRACAEPRPEKHGLKPRKKAD